MNEKQPKESSLSITGASRLVIMGTLSFIELSVKLMAGMVILASSGIKRIIRKKPE